MNKTWNESVRSSLKNANDCNEYFNNDRFQDGNFPIKIPLEFAKRVDKGPAENLTRNSEAFFYVGGV